MQYLPQTNIPCITYNEFIPAFSSEENYRQMKVRGKLKASCVGGNGRTILIELPSLPPRYQQKIIEKYGDPKKAIAVQPIKALKQVDAAARRVYANYELPNGRPLPLEYQLKYGKQADWLNVIKVCLTDKRTLKDTLKITLAEFWANIVNLINEDKDDHGLPSSEDRLRRRWAAYRDGGYEGLVEAWRFGNSHARKVTDQIEGLLLALYCQPYKPSMAEVCRDYALFMDGKKIVVDIETGMPYEPEAFYVKGKKYKVGESTVDYYVKQPGNEAIINKGRMNTLAFNTAYRPSVSRKAPFYAFSKITMDDIDVPFKTPDGDRAVKAYQIFDVASGAVIGQAYSRDKNIDLIREALRDMFRLIIRNNWGVPYEIEFEKHLTSNMVGSFGKTSDNSEVWFDDILTPGAVFPATRMCLGGNAKEKHAESIIRVKKYGQQKKRPGFQARHYARLLTNRLNAENDKVRYEYEQIVQNEMDDCAAHNAELHPLQDLYPGMTRWDVLTQNQNPNLAQFQMQSVIRHIGFSTATSIKAGMARVQYGDYELPSVHVLTQQRYAGELVAYYLPDENGTINSVYLFENDVFLCEAKRRAQFQEAIAEQTEADRAIMEKQWGQQKQHDKFVREGKAKIPRVATTTPEKLIKNGGELPYQNSERRAKSIAKKATTQIKNEPPKSAKSQALNDI